MLSENAARSVSCWTTGITIPSFLGRTDQEFRVVV